MKRRRWLIAGVLSGLVLTSSYALVPTLCLTWLDVSSSRYEQLLDWIMSACGFLSFMGIALVIVFTVLLFRERPTTLPSATLVMRDRASDYQPWPSPARRPWAAWSFGLGAFFNLVIVVNAVPFLFVPHGHGVRPMGWAVLMFVTAGAALWLGLPLALLSRLRGERGRLAGWGIVLSLTPLPLALILLHSLSAICGFELEP